MKRDTVIVLDFGTSGVKAAVVDVSSGALAALETRRYPWFYPGERRIEIVPDVLWRCAQDALGAAVDATMGGCHYLALTFSFFGHGMMLADENLEPTTNILLLTDKRCTDIYGEWAKEGREKRFREIAGRDLMDSAVPVRAMWFQREMPEVFLRSRYLFDVQQYVLSRMGQEPVNDDSMAVCKDLADPMGRGWSGELVGLFCLPGYLCETPVVGAADVVGR
ncbi:MAG: hypothetical protein LBR77_10545, partial [Lachnospiraceae bacterium]|nr:hypothetical protein [Lachnospiraceae bacterium]